MTTEESLIRGILTVPSDRTARLVFADWLEEQNQRDQAEIIRLRCALDLLPTEDETRTALQ